GVVRTLADAVRDLAGRHGLAPDDLAAVVVHGGNGRLPALVAKALGVGGERVWSETARTGNLGSASIPVAWAAREAPAGPVAFAAAGAGLQWGSALLAPVGDWPFAASAPSGIGPPRPAPLGPRRTS